MPRASIAGVCPDTHARSRAQRGAREGRAPATISRASASAASPCSHWQTWSREAQHAASKDPARAIYAYLPHPLCQQVRAAVVGVCEGGDMCGPANATRTIVHLNVVDLRDGVRWNVIDASRLSCVYVCVCARARERTSYDPACHFLENVESMSQCASIESISQCVCGMRPHLSFLTSSPS